MPPYASTISDTEPSGVRRNRKPALTEEMSRSFLRETLNERTVVPGPGNRDLNRHDEFIRSARGAPVSREELPDGNDPLPFAVRRRSPWRRAPEGQEGYRRSAKPVPRLPPSVATLRIWRDPNTASMSASAGMRPAAAWRSSSIVTPAPASMAAGSDTAVSAALQRRRDQGVQSRCSCRFVTRRATSVAPLMITASG